ncbi:unnamed protein product, partial [marine sediment metagenome]
MISVILKLGLVFTAVFLGPIVWVTALILAFGASFKNIFQGIINFLVNIFADNLRSIINMILAIAKLIPGLKNTQLVKDLDAFSKRLEGGVNVFGSVTPEPESQIGKIVPRSIGVTDPGQTRTASRLSQRSAAGVVGKQASQESAIRLKERDLVLQNQ